MAGDEDLVEHLLARAGAVLEDASVLALVKDEQRVGERIAALQQALACARALVDAAAVAAA